jgi:thiamine pyrophosphate-dependent acetolactate synthase large subunit-like protein
VTKQELAPQRSAAAARVPEYGSDVVAEMLRALGIEYAAYNPGATFKWIQDSLVNYGNDEAPRSILVCHEEISVAIGQGYGRAAMKPMAAIVHNLVGLQHASMAIFNAWCDRVPMLILGGTGPLDTTTRRPWIDWIHTSIDQAAMVRDYVKWDDQPHSAGAIPESLIRAYQVAMTEPTGPVYVNFDADLQEARLASPVAIPDVSRFPAPARLQADLDGLERLAALLVQADSPLIVAEYVGRHPTGFAALVELADLLAVPVIDKFQRHNFPTSHPMDLTGLGPPAIEQADLIVLLDNLDAFGSLNVRAADHQARPLYHPGTKLVRLSLGDLGIRAWAHNYHRLQPLDLDLYGDTAIALPKLVEFCRALVERDDRSRRRIAERRARVQSQHDQVRAGYREQVEAKWSSSPLSSVRLISELAGALAGRDYAISGWHFEGLLRGMMQFDHFNQFQGVLGGGGQGGYFGAAIGTALAYRGTDVFPVLIQPDGDLLYTPSALWTVAHEKTPFLTVMYNNRSYYNSQSHAAQVARERNRPPERSGIGTEINDPDVNFADLARTFGLYGEGPISDPDGLAPALQRAVAMVDQGVGAVVDVVCEPR